VKKLLTGLSVILVASVWMIGSWLFFNSMTARAEGSGPPAFAEGECGGHGGHHHHHHLWKKLDLTDAQKKEMFSIRLDEKAKMKPLIQKLKAGREQLRNLPKGQFDEAKVRAIAKEQADTITDLIVEKQRMRSKMYAVLTPEQRAKAEQLREQWKARHDKEHENKD
jgi:Spy/CpxP family protein refolding chaperone